MDTHKPGCHQRLLAFRVEDYRRKLAPLRLVVGCLALMVAGPAAGQPIPAASGTAQVTITGVDRALDVLRPQPGQQVSREQAGLVTALSIINSLGRPNGASRGFQIDVTEDGRVIINGVELAPLVRGFEALSGAGRK